MPLGHFKYLNACCIRASYIRSLLLDYRIALSRLGGRICEFPWGLYGPCLLLDVDLGFLFLPILYSSWRPLVRWVLEHAAVPYPFGVSRVWFVKSGKFDGLVGIYATHVLLGFVVSLPFHSPLPVGPNRRCPFDWLRVSKTAHIKIKILF